uniref:guanine nucleotide-exchange factor SEC12 n=1 Tax=Lonchura striata TaxID=40157 RepID=UPI000B4CCDF2|nr:prolactin regulatory element-binding protein [Lonchura striata domestica]
MAPRRPAELYRAPFPLYTVRLHPRRPLAITAGGGGAAKTGIRNGVHFLQLEQIGGRLSASLLHCHDTETRATMTMALAGDVIAAGQDNSCHILRFSLQEPEAPGTAGKDGEAPLRRLRCGAPAPGLCSALGMARNAPPACPGCCGGAEGCCGDKAFCERPRAHPGAPSVPALNALPLPALVPWGRMWGSGLHPTCPILPLCPSPLRRFGAVEGSAGALRLYTVQVPHKRERRPPPCYLTKWDGKSFLPLLTRPCGSEVVSCLSISDSGTFLGLGTVTGSVAIHIAFSLQRLYYVKEAHGIVVTDVAFVPESRPGRELLGGHEAALLSVAVDSRCKLHLLPTRRSLPIWLLLLLCAGLIVATILLLQLAFPGFL